MELKKNFKNFRFDKYLLFSIISLSVLGLINLAGVFGFESLFFKKQLIFLLAGFFILFFTSLMDYRIFRNHSFPSVLIFIVSIFLLLITLKAEPIRGVTAWLHFPLGLSFETSEIVKLALIIFLAKFFSSWAGSAGIGAVALSALYAIIPIFLIFSQPDLGSAIILFLIWFGGIILYGLNKEHFLATIIVLSLIIMLVGFFVLAPYQRLRIISFFDGFFEKQGSNYNILQSKIAIGSGGFLGLGFAEGSQAKFGILPESSSDFAFAALLEQFGSVGLVAVLLLYFIILNRLFIIGSRIRDNFSKFFIFLFLIYFFSHVVINIGMNLGLLPITGLPLPFISYGGSYLISLMIGFGIIESIRIRS